MGLAEYFSRHARVADVLDALSDAALFVGSTMKILHANAPAKALMPLNGAREPLSHVLELTSRNGDALALKALHDEGQAKFSQLLLRTKSQRGKAIPVELRVRKLRRGSVWIIRDLRETERMRQLLERQLRRDPVTQLLNRPALEGHIRRTLTNVRAGGEAALCVIGLDHFAPLNDNHGAGVGDSVLKKVGAAVQSCLGQGFELGRLGSDQYAVLVSGKPETAVALCEGILQHLHRLRLMVRIPPVVAQEVSVRATATVLPLDPAWTVEEVLAGVDAATRASKERARGGTHLVRPDDPALLQRREESAIMELLVSTLEQNSFRLYAQPIACVSTEDVGRVVKYEVLLRIPGDANTLLSPALFLPLAERLGVMPYLDREVFREAVQVVRGCPAIRIRADSGAAILTVNLSGQTVTDPAFADYAISLFEEFSVPPHAVAFEITESAAVSDLDLALSSCINKLRAAGCKFALDDFGAGYSSFAYLKRLPVEFLKIDGSLVRDITRNAIDRHLITMIASTAQSIGMQTVAEFVGERETLEILAEAGVDYAQGYLIGRPKPIQYDSRSGRTCVAPNCSECAFIEQVEVSSARCRN